ncbi:MAG TPA: hypothetical protein VFG46_21375 [Chryseolinea sp.]|nr:hypothetical protein [Chryseolinea sp.]
MRSVLILLALVLAIACSNKISPPKPAEVKWDEQSIKAYLDGNKDSLDPIEGIYSISSEQSEKFFLGIYTRRKAINDFARVAIVKDNTTFGAQFREVLIRGKDFPKYAKTADFTKVQRSLTYLSRQFSSNGDVASYSFEYDEKSGALIGRKTEGEKTTELQYLKLYPGD